MKDRSNERKLNKIKEEMGHEEFSEYCLLLSLRSKILSHVRLNFTLEEVSRDFNQEEVKMFCEEFLKEYEENKIKKTELSLSWEGYRKRGNQ